MELLQKYGYSLVFCVVFLEQLGLPIPAAPILVLSGALAAGGHLKLWIVFVIAAFAAFAGDFIWYEIGKRKGRGILRILCHVSLSPDSCVKKTEESFMKNGMNSLLFSKFVPGLNTIAPPMAGMFSASFLAFFWRELIGISAYVIAFLLPGFFFEKAVFDITSFFESLGRTFFWLLLGSLAAYVLMKYVKLKLLQRMLYKERITPEELHERMQAGEEFTIVDIRSNWRVDTDKIIPGAIRIPPGEVDNHIHKLDKEKWIVMYCT